MYKYKILKTKDIDEDFLSTFNRYQTNERIYYMNKGNLDIKDAPYVEEWNREQKEIVSLRLKEASKNGVVIGFFNDSEVIGFSSLNSDMFFDEYMNMPYLHIKTNYRGKGIGSKLFNLIALEAKRLGAKKMYISANPAYETMQFYLKAGTVLTKKKNEDVHRLPPVDIHLEYTLDYADIMHKLTTIEFKTFSLVNAGAISKVASRLYRYLPKEDLAFLEVCKLFFMERQYGYFSVATLWMKRRGSIITESNIKQLEKLLYDYCDNWARVDQYCYRVLNPMANKFSFMYDYMLKWSKSSNKDVRRASLVSMIISSKGQSLTYDYNKMIYLVNFLKHDTDFHVRKAVGWILKYAYVTYPQEVENYLRENVKNLDRMIFRYALEFVPNPLRSELISL